MRFKGAIGLGLPVAGLLTAVLIRSTNARTTLGGIGGGTRRTCTFSTGFMKLSGQTTRSSSSKCGRRCRIRNLSSWLGRERHWSPILEEMMMRQPSSHRSIARLTKFKSRHHPSSSAKLANNWRGTGTCPARCCSNRATVRGRGMPSAPRSVAMHCSSPGSW